MPSFIVDDIDFEVYCECGNGLCNVTSVEQGKRGNKLIISPCDKCQDNKYRDGYDDGYAEGERNE